MIECSTWSTDPTVGMKYNTINQFLAINRVYAREKRERDCTYLVGPLAMLL